jgi:hypothetical protein
MTPDPQADSKSALTHGAAYAQFFMMTPSVVLREETELSSLARRSQVQNVGGNGRCKAVGGLLP